MVLSEGADALGLQPGGGVADYTFTDQELTDILGYMESQDPTPVNMPFLGNPGSFQALQFLPRTAADLEAHASLNFPSTSAAGLGNTKQEPLVTDYRVELGVLPPTHPPLVDTPELVAARNRISQNGHKGDLPSGRKSGNRKGSTARASSTEYKHGHISHSTVEKQRRDRINALIDELRELVPPSQSVDGNIADGSAESKRPKHVVLSDTIALVKDLQVKIRDTPPQSRTVSGDCDEVRSPEGQEAKAIASKGSQDRQQQSRNSSDRESERSGTPPELPTAPEGAPVSPGVVVENGESGLYVKVNCKDRRGLLSDIIMSLKSMPLEIRTAAVTTTPDGHVHDVFEVKLDPRGCITAEDVKKHVQQSLTASDLGELGDKRRRVAES